MEALRKLQGAAAQLALAWDNLAEYENPDQLNSKDRNDAMKCNPFKYSMDEVPEFIEAWRADMQKLFDSQPKLYQLDESYTNYTLAEFLKANIEDDYVISDWYITRLTNMNIGETIKVGPINPNQLTRIR
jgi:hypothetical protein